MLFAMITPSAVGLIAALLLVGAEGLYAEKAVSSKATSLVRHEQKGLESHRQSPLEAGSLVAVGMQSRRLESSGKYRLLRHEDVFHTTKHEKTPSKPALAELHRHPDSQREYTDVKHDRKQVCMPKALGGKTLTQDPKFHAQTLQGRRAMSSKSIIFAGLVRDIGDSASRLFATLRVLGQSFANYHIIIIENNSQDAGHTHRGLERECTGAETWCFMLDIESMRRHSAGQHKPERVKHLTQLRQELLQQVRQLASTSHVTWDFVLMLDGDIFADSKEGGTSEGFHPAMLDALFGLPTTHHKVIADDPFDVVCGNQMANWPKPGRYRDTFALRNSSWDEPHKHPDNKDLYLSGNLLLPVKSCFSGLALYSMNAINSACNYTYRNEQTCEHVAFHHCLSQKGHDQVAIYPPLAVRTFDEGIPSEHCECLAGDGEASEACGSSGIPGNSTRI
mmetsp:Transcript_53214/g.99817  ORF Transcript_53214/g.99817 Transcript_53214/m.99817 type:complete len:449 (+) Transcript_53214:69-1415(+)